MTSSYSFQSKEEDEGDDGEEEEPSRLFSIELRELQVIDPFILQKEWFIKI